MKRYELYLSRGQWRWRLRAANGRIIANAGEAYRRKIDVIAAINLVKRSKSAPVREL